MKRLLALLFFSVLFNFSYGAHDNDLIIYVEQPFEQGSWEEGENMHHAGYNSFLLPVHHKVMMGTIDWNFPFYKILELLSDHHAGVFESVSIVSDADVYPPLDFVTVDITGADENNLSTILNTITASFTSDSYCEKVIFLTGDGQITMRKENLTIPFFAFRFPESSGLPAVEKPAAQQTPQNEADQNTRREPQDNIVEHMNLPLWISIALNLILIAFILFKQSGNEK